MIVALIDSGLGMLPTALWLRTMRPELDLILALDPDGAPWGPKPERWVIDRVLDTAQRCVDRGAEVIVLPCNTASVTALEHVRELVGPGIPVIGTVPAIKPAAAACDSVAIWATAATTASKYQADLIERFGNDGSVVSIACHGLAEAIDRGEREAASAAIASAAARTPDGVGAVVLGCTHYPLVADEIAASLPAGVQLFDSAEAVAAQTIRRIDALGVPGDGEEARDGRSGTVTVYLSGSHGSLPEAASTFPVGRLFAAGASQPS
ncbi:glutamate racemase [Rhodococcus tibetensis]|uniref:Aspartate/glutamate racemase family protein n=1 Tax=Rhodococcus tibetensis TaxID=2965064 RepID=A0ABT1QBZ7_9NOCA|nr:aspartate/glutamate racemase family protein [Rhodococcus sp. FXJ9.536]MCQ4119761.1 aspartate/glutamate racemase family protein [Rhodococcus sp. FXJ9.536]